MSIGYASFNSISLNINGIAQANSQNVIPALKTIYVSLTWTNQGITTISEGVFGNNPNLVGGSGTIFNSSNLSAEYAVIDSDTKNGYLTLKE